MIDFRYHVVSIVAVFLALALGLFLGSTTLQDAVVHTISNKADSVTKENHALDAQVQSLQGQLRANQKFDKFLLPFAVSDRLAGQLVSIVSAPDASDGVRKQLVTALEDAGATVSLDLRLQNAFTDPKQDAFLTSLAEHVTVPGDPAAGVTSGASRAAGQLAAVLGQRPSTRGLTAATIGTVLSTYSAAKLVNVGKTTTTRPGTLAVVLAGPAPSATADPTQVGSEQTLLLTFLRDLDATAMGAILAAPTPAQGSGPDVVASASSAGGLTRSASTVTGVDTPAGQIAAVFALAAQADGVSGRYGLAPQVTPLPTGTTSP